MLQKPGSRSGGPKAYSSNRRKTQESPTDQLRKISKLPPNKKCADCQAKLPQCINMSVGSFVCMTCGGLHRELNNVVKSLGHSTFTTEEVEMMSNTDNDKVNAIWLARYDPNRERMKPPQGDGDQNHLRAWIQRKYRDKQWYGGSGGPSQGGGGGQRPPPSQRGGAPQPTMVQIPPTQPAQEVDLFANFDAPAPAATAKQEDNWAGFGGSSQQQNSFASFGGQGGGGGNGAPDPFAAPAQAPPPPQQQQQNNFANFGGAPVPSADPFAQQAPPQQQNFANFGGQPQPQMQQPPTPQNQNFANFGGQQQSQQQDPFAQQMPPQQGQQQGGFANFNQQPPQMQQPPQQTTPPQQPPQMQQGGFADFNQQQPPQQQGGFANFHQQPQQQPPVPQQQQPSAQQAAFGSFNQQQQPQVQQAGFGNFNPQQQQQQPQAQGQMMPPPQQQPQQQMAQNNNFGNVNQMQGQPLQQDDPFSYMPQQQSEQQVPAQGGMGAPDKNMAGQSHTPPPPQQQQNQKDPMEAFAHLSVNDTGNQNNANSAPCTGTSTPVPHASNNPDAANKPKYEASQVVCYKSNGDRTKARVVKVHLDDELQPYYTIQLPFGKEKQTDDGHLQALDPAFERIESKLLAFTPTQLQQVETYLGNVALDTTAAHASAPAPASTVGDLPEPAAMKMDQVPTTIQPTSPGGMSHVSQLTQPAMQAINQFPVPKLGVQIGNEMINGGRGMHTLGTIPSPMPPEKAPAPSNVAGHMSVPPSMSNTPPPQQQDVNTNQMQPPAAQQNFLGTTQTQQQQFSNMGMGQMQPSQQGADFGGIPSPSGKAPPGPNQGQLGQMTGSGGAPPFVQQQPQMMQQQPPQQMMQGQMGGQQPQMMQNQMGGHQHMVPQQQPKQMMQSQMSGQPYTTQGQMMGQPQMMQQQHPPMMQGQMPPMMHQGQMPQQGQMQQQQGPQPTDQVPQSPQGNPFDMY
jgi:hypothetical protein